MTERAAGRIKAGFGLIKGVKPDIVGEGANVSRWLDVVGARPAVAKGMVVPQV